MQGTTFGPYTIEELLGRGGMGEVYRAFDTDTDREVALKVLPTSLAGDAEYTERFRRECRAAAKLREPHVVPIHRFGEIDGRLYLDMRLVEGTDLAARLHRHGPLAPAAAVAIVSQVASALDAAHAEGMVHRDVKPSNILLAGTGDGPVDPESVFAYLFDFGIASSTGMSDGSAQLTRSGTVPGSVAYLAPERFHGVPADRRVDVYALACVLYQALAGRQPFTGDLPTLMHQHLSVPPPPIGRPDVPPALEAVVGRGMAKDPDHRFPTAGELAAAARAAIGAGGSTPVPPVAVDAQRTSVFGSGPPQQPPQGWGSAPNTVIGNGWSNPSGPVVPPPAPSRRGPAVGAIVAIVAVVLVLAGGGIAAWQLIPRGSSPSPTPTPAPTTTVVPQTVQTTAPAGTGDAALLASLPTGFTSANCTPDAEQARTLGGTAFLRCTNGPADGPGSATFTRYAAQSQLDEAFESAARDDAVPIGDLGFSQCRTGARLATSFNREDKLAGRVGCYVEEGTGAAFVFWSDNAAQSFGYLRRDDGNAAVLYDWWLANDFSVH